MQVHEQTERAECVCRGVNVNARVHYRVIDISCNKAQLRTNLERRPDGMLVSCASTPPNTCSARCYRSSHVLQKQNTVRFDASNDPDHVIKA